jgi:SAM-dependent methyltransferase
MNELPGVQVAHEHYWSREYNTKERLCSFWHQLDEVLRLSPESVLEVGPGSGLVTGWLRHAGVQTTTVDVDSSVAPDVIGSVTDLPFDAQSFDVVLCAEVLEHLPWEDAEHALRELRRVARGGAVVSVPDDTPWVGKAYPLYYGLYAERLRREIPAGHLRPIVAAVRRRARWRDALWVALVPHEWGIGSGTVELKRVPVPHRPWQHDFDGEHYWELGTAGYPVVRFRRSATAAGFEIVRDFRVPENPWHHFFTLRVLGGEAEGAERPPAQSA